ncbi:unnamed protein product [Nezara viridula]|uniref:Uncharacterized protein n=1 Tax=Nezara viridula TaxID=85310 RepID=A0A9P0H2A0_NEZVI|nr:unnamed protein product [Nezara viridula]
MSARQLAGSSGLSDQEAVLSKLLKRKVRSNSSISSKDEHDAHNTGVPENVVQSSNATNTPTAINSIPNVPVNNRTPASRGGTRPTYTVPISPKLHNMTYAQETCTKTTYYNTTPQFTTAQTTSVTPHYAISHNIAPQHTTQITNHQTSNISPHNVMHHNTIMRLLKLQILKLQIHLLNTLLLILQV